MGKGIAAAGRRLYGYTPSMTRSKYILAAFGVCVGLMIGGCKPSQANIRLRKENQRLEQTIAELERQRAADVARIQALEGPSTRASLSQSQLDELFTVHGLKFGKLTGGYKIDDKSPEDVGVVVHVVPLDQQGEPLKAAGEIRVSLFDLAEPREPLVGHRRFSLRQVRERWYGQGLLYNYVLKVPFERQPLHSRLMVRVEFFDPLSGRVIAGEQPIEVQLVR